ncbi:MAG: hypothetical protein ABSF84_16525 [Acidimicrobiales bacterium]|jgi:arabinofuranosyltransferase
MHVALDEAGPPVVPVGGDGTGRSPSSHRLVGSWIVLVVPVLVLLVASWNYRWVQEDAFINFRIIGNLLAGHGPVYNVGERVEAYSDPLWLFLVALVHEVLPFASLEWTSVVLGLAFTVAGVLLGGRAVQRLVGARGDQLVVPIGLYLFSVVAGVWEFVTGGLEMGMVFGWIGLSFWLLVRVERRRRAAVPTAVLLGLGTLIRPELVLESVVFMCALILVVASPGWLGPTARFRRYGLPVVAAAALPLVYELFRMAYFALVVANTALAKSAGSTWWSQGFTYLWNFVAPYTLWLPFLLVVPLMVPRVVRWRRSGDRTGVVVLMTPIAAGLVDVLYVVAIGGDYQHARLLLPAFFAICVPLCLEVDQLRTLAVIPVVGIAVWSVVCLGWLRYDPHHAFFGEIHGISNERDTWIGGQDGLHPVALSSYGAFTSPARYYRDVAADDKHAGRQEMIISTDPYFLLSGQIVVPASSPLPVNLVVGLREIGSRGLVAGPDVYVFDSNSLANPIGAHMIVPRGTVPGGKRIGPAWMIARFGTPSVHVPASVATLASIDAARTALHCGNLASYLHAITSPLTFSRALSDLTHSFAFTTMTFGADPVAAERQLCR